MKISLINSPVQQICNDRPSLPRLRRRQRRLLMMQWINYFPDEIIFQILLRLPAHVLYYVMRYVCRQWCSIIKCPQFVSTHYHLQLASSTLLMNFPKRRVCYLYDVTGCHAKLSGYEFGMPTNCHIRTCNGLLLFVDLDRLNSQLYVGNPITRSLLALPQLPFQIIDFGIVFETSSKVYKVVAVYCSERDDLRYGCAILTVGINDAWRFLDCAHLTQEDMELLEQEPPITSTNFVYWATTYHPYILALDPKSESMKGISLPFCFEALKDLKYLDKGNSISVWYLKSDCSMEVWLLKDYKSEEWVKLLCIDGEPVRNVVGKVISLDELASSRKFNMIIPVCWLGNGEKILFYGVFKTCIKFVYDLKTKGCCPFDIEGAECFHGGLKPIVNSLTWIY